MVDVMTASEDGKGPPKASITRIGEAPGPLTARQKFLAWLREYATLLGVAGALAGLVIGAFGLLWLTTSSRFDDTATRIGDTKTEIKNTEKSLTDQIKNVDTKLSGQIKDVETSLETSLSRQIGEVKEDVRGINQSLQSLRGDLGYIKGRLDNRPIEVEEDG